MIILRDPIVGSKPVDNLKLAIMMPCFILATEQRITPKLGIGIFCKVLN